MDQPSTLGGIPVNADDFDPYSGRTNENGLTNWDVRIHMMKGIIGIGLIGMPAAFKNIGMITGFVTILAGGALSTYCMQLFVRCQFELCRRERISILNYISAVELALQQGPKIAKRMSRAVGGLAMVLGIFYQLGVCADYVLFTVSTVQEVSTDLTMLGILAALLLPCMLLILIPNLKMLVPVSATATLLIFVGLAVQIPDMVVKKAKTANYFVGSPSNVPMFLGTMFLALQNMMVNVMLENHMQHPEALKGYCSIITQTMASGIIITAVVGVLGYRRYGEDITETTLCHARDGPVMQVIRVCIVSGIFMSYPLQCHPVLDIIRITCLRNALKDLQHLLLLADVTLRTLIVLITFIVAASAPETKMYLALLGALCATILSIVIPALMDLCIMWPDNSGPYHCYVIKDVLIIICGVTEFVIGTYVTLRQVMCIWFGIRCHTL